jgi:hypothetical protein
MKFILNLLFLIIGLNVFAQSEVQTKSFRHLRFNHISPYIDLAGIHPIDLSIAESTSHYVFNYDKLGRLVEVINNHYHTERRHPLASLGVYRLVIEYKEDTAIWTFYNSKGARISNDREVYKEVYHYDSSQFKSGLKFYDLDDSPMESNWGISEYQWSRNDGFVIERRFNLANEAVDVSPYFPFGVTGILLDKMGFPKAHYNLDENLKPVNNEFGIASYKDKYDELGNHTEYSYYNSEDVLSLNQWQFAIGRKSYDEQGNQVLLEQFDKKGELLRSRRIANNTSIELSGPASSKDSVEISMQSLGYLKALQQLDSVLMDQVMNDSLNKVTIDFNRDLRKEVARGTTKDNMIAFAKDWNKSNTKFPPVPNDEVKILSIYNRIASVQLISDNWVEYLHLIKLNGKWEVVNIIWQYKDINLYPK